MHFQSPRRVAVSRTCTVSSGGGILIGNSAAQGTIVRSSVDARRLTVRDNDAGTIGALFAGVRQLVSGGVRAC